MSAEDVEPQVELEPAAGDAPAAENGAAEQDPEARYRYDESLLIKTSKGTVRRPQKPDEQERNLAVEKLNAEIDKRSARIKEIKEMVEATRSARSAGASGNQEIVRRVKALQQEFQTILRQKQHIREELQLAIKQRADLRTLSKQLRDKLPRGVTADSIDTKIAELEYKMAHEDSEDHKVLFKRIGELKSSRPAFKEYGDVEAKLKAIEDARAEIQHRLQQCDAVLTDVKAREDAERAVLEQARSKAGETELDIPALNVEKKECWEIIQVLRAKRDEVRKEFNARYTEYIKLDRNYQNYMRSVKREEYLARKKAREEREAAENGLVNGDDAEGKDAEGGKDTVVVEAYAAEVFTLDQLVTHLRKLLPSDDKAVSQEEKKAVEVPQGMKLLKKKDEDDFMTVQPKKKGGKGKGAAAAAAPSAEPAATKAAEPAKKKLNHTLEALKTFMQFNIEVPQTTAELSATIEKALAKKEYYLELRRTGKKHVPAPAKAPKVADAPAGEPSTSGSAAAPAEAATSNGSAAAQAEAPATKEPVAASPAKKSAAPTEGLGLSLAVDDATESVSIKLNITDN